MSDISNIDELLTSSTNSTQPDAPEMANQDEILDEDNEAVDYGEEQIEEPEEIEPEAEETENDEKVSSETDDYGNEKERMSKGMKDRLDRKEKQHQREIEQREREIDELRAQLAQTGASREIQKAAKDFEYDPNEDGNWQEQLKSFVKQTVSSMSQEQEQAKRQQEEAEVQREFEKRFHQGMSKFEDFREVVSSLDFEITNPMTLATRAMADPAAFLYAAAKRQPQELQRISKLRDPYAQMTEMGKLEERMRKNKSATQAPKPIGRSKEDAPIPQAKKKTEPSIEDMIAKADAKRMEKLRQRNGVRR